MACAEEWLVGLRAETFSVVINVIAFLWYLKLSTINDYSSRSSVFTLIYFCHKQTVAFSIFIVVITITLRERYFCFSNLILRSLGTYLFPSPFRWKTLRTPLTQMYTMNIFWNIKQIGVKKMAPKPGVPFSLPTIYIALYLWTELQAENTFTLKKCG